MYRIIIILVGNTYHCLNNAHTKFHLPISCHLLTTLFFARALFSTKYAICLVAMAAVLNLDQLFKVSLLALLISISRITAIIEILKNAL